MTLNPHLISLCFGYQKLQSIGIKIPKPLVPSRLTELSYQLTAPPCRVVAALVFI